MARCECTFNDLKLEDVIQFWWDPPPAKMKMIKEKKTIEEIDENT